MARPASLLSPPSPCEYLPDRISRLRYEFVPEITPTEYMTRLREGWRRFGPVAFRPECPGCRMCQSLRVPVQSFQPNESQRRAWRRNERDVHVHVGRPAISEDRLRLFTRFHEHGEQTKGWPPGGTDIDLFVANPFPIEEWTYRVDGRLIAVGYVDVLAEGLSAIYFYRDPGEKRRSLGTFNILALIASAARRKLPHVYLGYYVEGCRSLEYKGRFRPNEILGPEGEWIAFAS